MVFYHILLYLDAPLTIEPPAKESQAFTSLSVSQISLSNNYPEMTEVLGLLKEMKADNGLQAQRIDGLVADNARQAQRIDRLVSNNAELQADVTLLRGQVGILGGRVGLLQLRQLKLDCISLLEEKFGTVPNRKDLVARLKKCYDVSFIIPPSFVDDLYQRDIVNEAAHPAEVDMIDHLGDRQKLTANICRMILDLLDSDSPP